MRIQIDGVGNVNKGAELMFYAILQEIERKYPDAEVLYNRIGEDISCIKTNLNIKTRRFAERLIPMLNKMGLRRILGRLSLPYSFFTSYYPLSNINIVLDAGGFQFSDQWKLSDESLGLRANYYRRLKAHGTKIIFLPQAFGPFESVNGKKIVEVISQYADIIFVREKKSYNYLVNAGADFNKLKLYPDFTALIEGIIPEKYRYLKGRVCIIPNMRMIDKQVSSKEKYLNLLYDIVELINRKGKEVFLLNHEGEQDALLCNMINERQKLPVPIVDNLNALEVKGIISQSCLLISSRFHGVASALNSGVPCLATSWSHKYVELFKDYIQDDCLLDLNNNNEIMGKVEFYLSEERRIAISRKLKSAKMNVLDKNREMWRYVWETTQ